MDSTSIDLSGCPAATPDHFGTGDCLRDRDVGQLAHPSALHSLVSYRQLQRRFPQAAISGARHGDPDVGDPDRRDRRVNRSWCNWTVCWRRRFGTRLQHFQDLDEFGRELTLGSLMGSCQELKRP